MTGHLCHMYFIFPCLEHVYDKSYVSHEFYFPWLEHVWNMSMTGHLCHMNLCGDG